MINPAPLKKWDTIGIIAPSSWFWSAVPHRVQNWLLQLERMWFHVKLGKTALSKRWYVSWTVEERIWDIHSMFLDKEVKGIIACIWGYHSNELIKYIDYEIIKNNPKIFVGYSDNTILHYAFYTQANLRTYYGPCIMTDFWEYPEILPYTREYFEKGVINKEPIGKILPSETWTDELLNWWTKDDLKRPRTLEKNLGYEWWQEGEVVWEIIGGAIPSINQLLGTKYWINVEEKILFIDIPEWFSTPSYDPFFIAHDLADLDNAWIFEKISWLIIGRPYKYWNDPWKMEALKEIVLRYTHGKSYPVLFNVNIGHAAPIITLPMGVMTRLSSSNNDFSILESWVTN